MTSSCPECQCDVEATWNFCPACGWQVQQFYNTIRRHVFEAIVRHAIRGGSWKESCLGPMQHNQISIAEIESEVRRRKTAARRARAAAVVRGRMAKTDLPISKKLSDIRGALTSISRKNTTPVIGELAGVIEELEQCLRELEGQVESARKIRNDRQLKQHTDAKRQRADG
ncbi:MAG TPA: zinc ribbon domain-containing protein [Planktothrix sp.]